MSVVSLLHTERTNLPGTGRGFTTGGAENATTNAFYWDYSYAATVLALLDPELLRDSIAFYLSVDIHGYWGVEYLSGHGIGDYYAANDVALFTQILAYARVSNDWAYLDQTIGNQTVLDWLWEMATYWQQLSDNGKTDWLADYGGAHNLLECVPTYIHKVAAFNAGNVWMMETLAGILVTRGDFQRAKQLQQLAANVAADVLSLYSPGNGFWQAKYPNGTLQQVRTVCDWAYVLEFMHDHLTPSVMTEMATFFNDELRTPHWMRALSLKDPAAKLSNRSDHGPSGAYDGWPPKVIHGLVAMGLYDEAKEFLYACVNVTFLGPYGQAHEVRPPGLPYKPWVFTLYNEMVGASWANVIIESIFGFRPPLKDSENDALVPWRASDARGFEGRLSNVRWAGRQFDLVSGPEGISVDHSTH
eukprot:TRINITY_DN11928_c0_g1_i1.p1 TRINITY_DN11928_c0_g1~~TRINITY_DN11928_c0_g1_i1.p1  ORF type:complete len:416 (+),score=142.57 TRINITY_DN11928_c0_g1_i1:453-1700(+)